MYTNRSILSTLSAGITVALVWILLTSRLIGGQETIWIEVDTKALTLKVMQGNQETLAFRNIAIGRYGTDTDRRRGDNTTPLGHFTIAWITDDTPYHRFFGFRYPNKERAKRAFQAGDLDKETWNTIRQAFASGRLPPQDTLLGGNLGIHGIGAGDINVHEQYNWTNGCVALTNDQIDRLTTWIRVGTLIEIR